MTRLRLVPYRRLRAVVEQAGFQWMRTEGSHNIFRHAGGRITVVPDHGGVDGPGVPAEIPAITYCEELHLLRAACGR